MGAASSARAASSIAAVLPTSSIGQPGKPRCEVARCEWSAGQNLTFYAAVTKQSTSAVPAVVSLAQAKLINYMNWCLITAPFKIGGLR